MRGCFRKAPVLGRPQLFATALVGALIGAAVLGAAMIGPPEMAAADELEQVEERVKRHYERILPKLTQKEQAARQLANSKLQKWEKGKQYQLDGQKWQGPEEHPWMKRGGQKRGVNRNSKNDYIRDSKNAWDTPNFLTQTWSCFEPQLVAIQENCVNVIPRMAEVDLGLACLVHCCLDNPFNIDREGWEVTQFWYPEHQAGINNYGRNRLDPSDRTLTGANDNYLYQRLVQVKEQRPEREEKDELEEEYPLREGEKSKIKPPTREYPYIGQPQWGGTAGDWGDHMAAHLYRTHIAAKLGDEKPETREGWEPEKLSILDALAPKTNEKQHLHIWTEYDHFDALTTNDSLWFTVNDPRIRRLMQAILVDDEAVKLGEENPAFYQDRRGGPARYRIARWPNPFDPMRKIAEIQPDNRPELKELVYYGGTELYPASMSMEGFEVPNLAIRATLARRGFEIAGNKTLSKQFPGGEKARANTYTIDGENVEKEIDKMQMVYPMVGAQGTTSECFRSQRIPSMLSQTEHQWTEKNLPHDHMGYVEDDFSDSNFVYWNKRVVCSCRLDGAIRGSVAMNWVPDRYGPGRGDGDRQYGRIENKLCTYREGELPSAWAGEDRPSCETNPNTKNYEGIDDNV